MCTLYQDERALLVKKIELLDMDSVTQIIEIAKEFDDKGGEELDLDDAPREALWRIQAIVDAAESSPPTTEPAAEPEPASES